MNIRCATALVLIRTKGVSGVCSGEASMMSQVGIMAQSLEL